MRIPSSKIPQADSLDEVLSVTDAVYRGAKTYQDIAKSIRKVERQGRYYRLAAEILGLVRNYRNNAELTDLGMRLVSSDPWSRKEIARNAVLSAHVFQRMLPLFELHPNGITRDEIERFIEQVTEPTTKSMIHRRASTLLSWLEEIGVLLHSDDKYEIRPIRTLQTPILELPDEEPLAPKSLSLNEYETVQYRTAHAGQAVQVLINQAAHEKANETHHSLVDLVADRLRASNLIPKNNRYVDLATTWEDQPYLFEMKSINEANAHSQLRAGLSQLYEYRYLQNLPNAKLVLVISNPLRKRDSWIREYLEEDRKIHLIWDGDKDLFASSHTKADLSFLWRQIEAA